MSEAVRPFPYSITTHGRSGLYDNGSVIKLWVAGGELEAVIGTQESKPIAFIEFIDVKEDVQKQGRGSFLLYAFAREAARAGVEELNSQVTNPQALRNRLRVFGPNIMSYFDNDREGNSTLLPLTDQQALDSLMWYDRTDIEIEDTSADVRSHSEGIRTVVLLDDPVVQGRLQLKSEDAAIRPDVVNIAPRPLALSFAKANISAKDRAPIEHAFKNMLAAVELSIPEAEASFDYAACRLGEVACTDAEYDRLQAEMNAAATMACRARIRAELAIEQLLLGLGQA